MKNIVACSYQLSVFLPLASKVSCDENGVSVVQFSNSLDITVVWRRPSRRKRETVNVNETDNETFYEKYAVQLGEVKNLPPPVGEHLINTNVSVLESVRSFFTFVV